MGKSDASVQLIINTGDLITQIHTNILSFKLTLFKQYIQDRGPPLPNNPIYKPTYGILFASCLFP